MKRSDTVPPRRGTRTWRVAWGVVGLAAAGQLSMALTRPPSGEVTAAALDAAATAADRAAKAAESPAPEVPAAGASEIVPPAVPAPPAAPSAVAESPAPAEKPAETADADPFTGPGVLADPHPEMLAPAGPEPAYDPAEALLREKGLPPPASQDGKPVIAAPVLIPPPVQSAPEPAPLDTPITDEYVLSRLEEGMHLRGLGDLQGALKPLREALEKQPDHPRLLYQLARTLDSMGLMRKAQPVWEKLRSQGKDAGDYFALAMARMRDGVPVSTEPEEEMGGALTISSLEATRVPDAVGGQRVQFLVKVKKITKEPVDVEKDLAWTIHFFDSVNGRSIARSVAAPPQLTPVSVPMDWADGEESFSFEYWQPEMTPQELVSYGRCRYYGCTVELSWKERIQDVEATTPELRDIARELPIPEEAPPDDLLRGPSRPVDAPEASLFPPNILIPSGGR